MDIFSANPRSFKLDRKSPVASKLKASIARKLFEFLGNYSDDVLAEYIVVLVCNGKHQHQAREDLEAFLGDESGTFVAWLWSHLAVNVNLSTSFGSPNLEKTTVSSVCDDDDVDLKGRTSRHRDLQNHKTELYDNPLSIEKKELMLSTFLPKSFSANPPLEGSEDYQHCHSGFRVPLTVGNTEEVHAQTCRSEVHDDRSDSCNEAIKFQYSRGRCSFGISAIGEECLQYEDQYKKIVNFNNNGPLHQLLHSPKGKPVLGNLQSVVTEKLHSRPLSTTNAAKVSLSSRAKGAVPHHSARRRGNVWDRLGKPSEDNAVMTGDKIFPHVNDSSGMKKFEHKGEGFNKHSLMSVVPDGSLSRRLMDKIDVFDHISDKVVSNNHSDRCRELEHCVDSLCRPNDTSISRQKRKLGEICPGDGFVILSNNRGKNLQDEDAFSGVERLSPIKHGRPLGMNGVTSDTQSSDCPDSDSTHHLLKSTRTVLNPEAQKTSQAQLNRETPVATPTEAPVSVSSSLPAKSVLLSHSESGHANHRPVQSEVLDVKLRLRQIEMEMAKLRSKQAEKKNDAKLNALTSSSTQNHSEDDIESRTVFVTNVHFAATKETLLSHFSKCGMGVKVTLLTDTVTAQPKGSAYILFASKESADKAVAMNGTSFFSRTLKVVRKADMPLGVSAPAQPIGKPLQQCYSLPRPYSSSHLQWRRGQQQNAENSVSAQAGTLEASRTAEGAV